MKKFGTLYIQLVNGKELNYVNVECFNLINGEYFIWIYRKPCINISCKLVHNFYYSVTPY